MPATESSAADASKASAVSFVPYRRVAQPWTGRRLSDEYLDQASCGGDALARELGFLRVINAIVGGSKLSVRAVQHFADARSLLDVGTGSGDIARALALAFPSLTVTGVDRRREMVEHARARTPVELSARVGFVEGDLFKLPAQFGAAAFDVSHASLTLHHFGDDAVVDALASLARVSRRGVVWNDLLRGPLPLALVRATTCFASRSTRHDARVSVEAGFTRDEVEALAARAKLRVASLQCSHAYRFAAVLVA